MIVQACLNGARSQGFHPRLPVTPDTIASDARSCVAAGAGELHVHPRDADGRERLGAVDAAVSAVRQACPGTLVGVSTGAWIESDSERTRAAIRGWADLPDYASVNLSEADAPAVMDLLRRRGVGVEAGLSSVADAERLASLADDARVFRILIEPEDRDIDAATAVVDGIAAVLHRTRLRRPVLLHGFDATVWPLVALARARGWSTRVGLEDGGRLPDGSVAADNAALVAAAVRIFHAG